MRKKSLTAMSIALLASFSLVGCTSVQKVHKVQAVPAPAYSRGMTLEWEKDIKKQALTMIQGSQHYVYLDIYELSDADILQALINAHQRGVDVRVVVDATEQHSQKTAVPALKHAGIPVESLHIHEGISHIKMLITDGAARGVLIGGMNFGQHSWSNNDASVYISHPNPSYLAVFRWDWKRAGGQPAAAPSTQMPLLIDRQIGPHVVQAIAHAEKSVELEGFDISDWNVISALKMDVKRGLRVEVLLDPNQSLNRRASDELRDAGVTVRFYRPYHYEWMHAKIVDIDKGRIFIIGSANFSHQAYTYNHEGDLELYNVPAFNQALVKNMSIQLARGTDYPKAEKYKQSRSDDH
ncbi:phosphatidylserine/phosphatidylglycerophosphate/cardiolipin synthase family protein [Alicyclobacillus sp. SO9]|uniref:phospholipase D-like domain-containing protein n=1 Tax=Alicyclobacillus sp. SO9 TaxID=2665646 RepID=UPI0018E8834B|nr:phospholipase D-like domain-containing protein [Alicyclobacillus sp. SO9]QQE80338.1 phosphatidylserine/phosphatidylglycerophosphate/cardiolipin synthase family protein [Alicyclobacillus sp. SO9]